MAWTTPRTWVTGEVVTAALMNAHVRDNENFLYTPPMCRAYRTTDKSLANTTATAIDCDAESFDTDSMHSTAVNTTRMTINTASKYDIGGSLNFAAGGGGTTRYGVISVGGATNVAFHQISGDTGKKAFCIGKAYAFTAAQYFELYAWQDSGGALLALAQEGASDIWAMWGGN